MDVIHAAEPSAPADTLAAVRAEQVRHWRDGERTPAEALLARHPALAADPESALVLVYGEALLREELDGTPPDPAEYAARFPAYASALGLQFELHGALGPGARPDLPGFEIIRELGRGGVGVVYLACETALDRLVAVKVLLSGEFSSSAARQRFRTEAEAAARLKHPHIVEVHAFGDHGGRPYLVLEYVPGGSLDRQLNGTPLDPRAAAEFLLPLADAVRHAHDAGIVHRDLKPANVLVSGGVVSRERSKEGGRSLSTTHHSPLTTHQPKIADFGLAKRLDADAGPTATSQILGTPSYMAPEQAAGAKAVGPAADIYALGAILYECLTGRPPFKAATALDTLAQITNREPAAPRSINPMVPRDLETVCLKCLAKEPAKRYRTAGEFAKDLARFLDGRPVLARPVGPVGRTWRWAKRRPAIAGLAAALAVLIPGALAGMTALYLRADRQRQLADERYSQGLEQRYQTAVQMSKNALSLNWAKHSAEAVDARQACIAEFGQLAELGVHPTESRLQRAENMDMLAITLYWLGRIDDAWQMSQESLRALDVCQVEQPESMWVRASWLRGRHNHGAILRAKGRYREAAGLFDSVVAEFHSSFGACDARDDPKRDWSCSLYYDRAMARYHLHRYAEAVADYDEALRRDNGDRWVELTLCRANSLARCGRAAEAVAQCSAPLANPTLGANWVFEASIALSAASVAPELSSPDREAAAVRAVETLRRLVTLNSNYRREIRSDAAFNPLRGRPDFQALLAGK